MSAGDYSKLADGDRKGVLKKPSIYSDKFNGVSAMAVFESAPDSGHSAVALETTQEPQMGQAVDSRCKVENASGPNKSESESL